MKKIINEIMETLRRFYERLRGKERKVRFVYHTEMIRKKKELKDVEKFNVRRPVPESCTISSPFGWRDKPKPKYHNGIDFKCPVGTQVMAMVGGKVYITGWENDLNHDQGFGLRVWQEFHKDNRTFYCWYGHLSKINVVSGQDINVGHIVGLSGNTGESTGPHLHVQIREKDTNRYFNMEFYI